MVDSTLTTRRTKVNTLRHALSSDRHTPQTNPNIPATYAINTATTVRAFQRQRHGKMAKYTSRLVTETPHVIIQLVPQQPEPHIQTHTRTGPLGNTPTLPLGKIQRQSTTVATDTASTHTQETAHLATISPIHRKSQPQQTELPNAT